MQALWLDFRYVPSLLEESLPDLNEGAVSEGADENEDPNNWKSLDYIHDQIGEQFEHQSDLWDTVDGRLRLILGVIGIAFAGGLALRSPTAAVSPPSWLPVPLIGVVAGVAVALYMTAAAIVARVYLPATFNWPPEPANLRAEFLMMDPRETKLAVVDTMIKEYRSNELIIWWKTRWFVRAFALTAAATFMLGLAVIGNIAWQTQAP